MQKSKASSGNQQAIARWVSQEFSGANFPDKRLWKRAQQIMTQLSQQPTASIPQACGQWSDIKSAYRFFDNEAIQAEQLLAPHRHATIARMRSHKVVLVVQDTTSLNYSTHPNTEGLGPISNNQDKTIGLLLHTSLALSGDNGQPLGILAAEVNARDKRQFGRSRQSVRRNRLAVQDKESQRWLESLSVCQQIAPSCGSTTLINVADREGDIYELFAQGLNRSQERPVYLLVRAQHDRKVEGEHGQLWRHLDNLPMAGSLEIKVPRQAGQAARMTTLQIRFEEITVCAPSLKRGQPSLKLWAIEARETHPPKGQAGILWRLLTTWPVTSVAEAMQAVRWYAQRWQIEVFHKVLKSGCRIEQRQLQTAARLKRVLMMDMIIAWRIMLLNKAARENPEDPADQWLLESEWKVLWCYMNPGQQPPQDAPGLRQTVRWIGRLGGFIGRKSDGEPGSIVLWRGLHRLHDMTCTWNRLRYVGNA